MSASKNIHDGSSNDKTVLELDILVKYIYKHHYRCYSVINTYEVAAFAHNEFYTLYFKRI